MALLTLLAARAEATTSLCSITGQVLKPDNSPCANCQINFNPPNKNPQIPVGTTVPIYVQPVYTTTDANGNLAAISLIQGIVMVTTIQDPASGSYSAALPVIVPFTTGTTFTQLLGQNALTTGTTQINGLSVGTRTLTPSGANCSAGVCTSLITDFMLMCDASTGNVEYDLPPSSGGGRWFDMVKVDSSANSCTFKANGIDTVNGAATQAFSDQYDSLMENDGQLTKWYGVGPTVFTSLTLNKLNPKNLDGTDTIGPFNGTISGSINIDDFGTVGQNSWGTERTSCVTQSSSSTMTCAGIGSTHFAVGQHIYVPAAGSAATSTTPTIVVNPVTFNSTYTSQSGVITGIHASCSVANPFAWGTSGQTFLYTQFAAFEQGDTFTVGGNTYTVASTNNGVPGVNLTSSLLTQVTGRNFSDGATTATSATLTSASGAAFVSADIGRAVTGHDTASALAVGVLTSAVTLPTATIQLNSGSGFSNTSAVVSIGSGNVTCTGFSANALTGCSGGTGSWPAGTPVYPTISAVGGATSATMSEPALSTGTSELIFLGSQPVTGATCTKSKSYEAQFIYPNGTYGPLSACVTTTASANALNWYNVNQVQGSWDANALAVAIYEKNGASCSGATLAGFEIPTNIFNAQGYGANSILNDTLLAPNLLSGAPKNAPTVFTFHDVDLPYGQDEVAGTSPVVGGRNGTLLTTITGINGTSVALNTPAGASVTANMGHDDGPPINAALAASVVTPIIDKPYYLEDYFPAGNYPVATLLTFTAASGLNLHGASGVGFGGTNSLGTGLFAATRLVTHGPMGSVFLPIYNMPTPQFSDIQIDDTGGSTPGVGIDVDITNRGLGLITGQGTLEHFSVAGANTALRVSNVDSLNVEFMNVHDFVLGAAGNSSASKGFETLSGNALGWDIKRGVIQGNIGMMLFNGENFDNIDCPQNGGVCMWAAPYFQYQLGFNNSRQEHIGRWFYSPIAGGATHNFNAINNYFDVPQIPPDCGFIAESSPGPFTLTGNGIANANGSPGGQPDRTCPTGIFVNNAAGYNINALGNTWQNIPNAFGELIGSGTASYKDQYRDYNGAYTTVPQVAASSNPPSILQVSAVQNGACTTSIPVGTSSINVIGWSGGNCTMSQNGTATFFATTQQPAFTFSVNYSNQLPCTWYADGSNAPVLLGQPSENVSAAAGCSSVQNTTNSVNFYRTGAFTYQLQNNVTSSSNVTHVWSAVSGPAVPFSAIPAPVLSWDGAIGGMTSAAVSPIKAGCTGHFLNLACTATLTGSCTGGPVIQVQDITGPTADGTNTSSPTTTVATIASATPSLTFTSGDTIALGIKTAGSTCTAPTYHCSATTSCP